MIIPMRKKVHIPKVGERVRIINHTDGVSVAGDGALKSAYFAYGVCTESRNKARGPIMAGYGHLCRKSTTLHRFTIKQKEMARRISHCCRRCLLLTRMQYAAYASWRCPNCSVRHRPRINLRLSYQSCIIMRPHGPETSTRSADYWLGQKRILLTKHPCLGCRFCPESACACLGQRMALLAAHCVFWRQYRIRHSKSRRISQSSQHREISA